MKNRCNEREAELDGERKAAVMAEMKQNLPIEMRVNDLYGLSHSVTNLNQGADDRFGSNMRKEISHISVYEDVS